jgi:hypothetical protein
MMRCGYYLVENSLGMTAREELDIPKVYYNAMITVSSVLFIEAYSYTERICWYSECFINTSNNFFSNIPRLWVYTVQPIVL